MKIAFALLVVLTSLSSMVVSESEDDYLGVIGPAGRFTDANYSEYTPAFAEFMSDAAAEENLSTYPEYLVAFLNQTPESPINYSDYSPALQVFMNDSLLWNLSAYPLRLDGYLFWPPAVDYDLYSPAFGRFMDEGSRVPVMVAGT